MRVSARACIYIDTNIWHFNASYSLVELHKKQMTLSEHRCRLLVNCCNQIAFYLFHFILIHMLPLSKIISGTSAIITYLSVYIKFNLKNNFYSQPLPELGREKNGRIWT